MLSSEWKKTRLKFLLDENVKKKLLIFLELQGYDVITKPKGLSNGKLAKFSKSEGRIFVTNDRDFLIFNDKEMFSLVLIKVAQSSEALLIESFSKLLEELPSEKFKGSLITLFADKFDLSPLV